VLAGVAAAIAGAAVVLWPKFPLIGVMFVSQVVNGVLLPFSLIFVLLLINRRSLMGESVNGPIFNVVAWLTVAVMIGLTLMLVANSFGVSIGGTAAG